MSITSLLVQPLPNGRRVGIRVGHFRDAMGHGRRGCGTVVAEKMKPMEHPDVPALRLEQVTHCPRAGLYADSCNRDESEQLGDCGDCAGHRAPPVEEARGRRTCLAEAL